MKDSIPKNTALLVVDVQLGFDDPKWGRRNNPDAESNISRLIHLWRSAKRPVIHVQHCSVEPESPLRPDRPGCQFKSEATPIDGEPVFKKTVNSAFIGTELDSYLKNSGIEHSHSHCQPAWRVLQCNYNGFTYFKINRGE